MKVKLDSKFKNLSGQEGQMSLGQIIGEVLYTQVAFADWSRSNQLAKDLYADKEVELSAEDHKLLVDLVKSYAFSGGVKEQILEILQAED